MRRRSSVSKDPKTRLSSGGGPGQEPHVRMVLKTIAMELCMPFGVGLDIYNTITEVFPEGQEHWQVKDQIAWVDGTEVRKGCYKVSDALDKGRGKHQLIVQRMVPETPGIQHFTVRLQGNPGLGIGLTEDNIISDLQPGGIAALEGRLQVGDHLLIFDGVDVSKGKAMLSQIFDPNRYVHELVVMRYLKPPQPSRASTSGKGKGRVAPPKPTRFNLMVPPVLLPPDPKDKKGIPERQLPFMLDKKHALTAISADVDELIPGDVLVSIDGKSVSASTYKGDAKKLGKLLDVRTETHVVTFDRYPADLTPEDAEALETFLAAAPTAEAPTMAAAPTAAAPTVEASLSTMVAPAAAAPTAARSMALTHPDAPTHLPATGSSRFSVSDTPGPSEPAQKDVGSRKFAVQGWSNSASIFKAVYHGECSDPLSADLPKEIGLKYIKRADMPASGLIPCSMRVTGDTQRLDALVTFFEQHNRVGQLKLADGGSLFLVGKEADGTGWCMLFKRTPPTTSLAAAPLASAVAPPVAAPPVAAPPVAAPPVATPPVAAPPVAAQPVAAQPSVAAHSRVVPAPLAAPPVAAPPVAAPPEVAVSVASPPAVSVPPEAAAYKGGAPLVGSTSYSAAAAAPAPSGAVTTSKVVPSESIAASATSKVSASSTVAPTSPRAAPSAPSGESEPPKPASSRSAPTASLGVPPSALSQGPAATSTSSPAPYTPAGRTAVTNLPLHATASVPTDSAASEPRGKPAAISSYRGAATARATPGSSYLLNEGVKVGVNGHLHKLDRNPQPMPYGGFFSFNPPQKALSPGRARDSSPKRSIADLRKLDDIEKAEKVEPAFTTPRGETPILQNKAKALTAFFDQFRDLEA